MHSIEPVSPSTSVPEDLSRPWYAGLTRYHWFVLVVAALGWLFDTMDQQLFTLARAPAMRDLLGPGMNAAEYGGYATSIFLIGWALGGVAFGIMGDAYGRARTMLVTILMYSVCTGLSAFSVGFWDFALYRLLTGFGVGGEFAVGVALVAETMPDRARPHALGWLQALSAVGNISAALISLALVVSQRFGILPEEFRAWRAMFLVGTVPALLALLIRRSLKEPERWQKVAVGEDVKHQAWSVVELFVHPRWRHHTLVGLALAFAGVVGLWGIGFFSPDLQRRLFTPELEAQGLGKRDVEFWLVVWTSVALILQNVGGFFGIHVFMWLTHRFGRRGAFAACFPAALLSTVLTFFFMGKVSGMWDAFWMIPVMGLCQLSVFGGYAIYFPELFPTRLRSTGTSFCYNVGRLVAAVGPAALGLLTSRVFVDCTDPMRWAGMTMSAVFLIGLLALPFAPETKGQPLPE